jgi:mRNA interferase RelE/StbE
MPLIGFAFTDCALDFLAGLPPKIRKQVVKRAKALHTTPFPASAKKLQDVETPLGEAVYRERSGDYRILYVVRTNPAEIIILDIDHRKDVYRMPKTNPKPADEMRMKQADFDDIMRGALAAPAPKSQKSDSENRAKSSKRMSAYPAKRKQDSN